MKKILKLIKREKTHKHYLVDIKRSLRLYKTACISKDVFKFLSDTLQDELNKYINIETENCYYIDMTETYMKKFKFEIELRPTTR